MVITTSDLFRFEIVIMVDEEKVTSIINGLCANQRLKRYVYEVKMGHRFMPKKVKILSNALAIIVILGKENSLKSRRRLLIPIL